MKENTYGIPPVIKLYLGAGSDFREESSICGVHGWRGRFGGYCGWARSWFDQRLSRFNRIQRLSRFNGIQRLSRFNRIHHYRTCYYCGGNGWRGYNAKTITQRCGTIPLCSFITYGVRKRVVGGCGVTYTIMITNRLHMVRDTC